jgi:hypothetical protein
MRARSRSCASAITVLRERDQFPAASALSLLRKPIPPSLSSLAARSRDQFPAARRCWASLPPPFAHPSSSSHRYDEHLLYISGAATRNPLSNGSLLLATPALFFFPGFNCLVLPASCVLVSRLVGDAVPIKAQVLL